MSAVAPAASDPGSPPARGPSRGLVTAVSVLVVAALAALPAVGPETWGGVTGSAPLRAVAHLGTGALGLVHAVGLALVALAVLQATRDLADPLRRLAALAVAVAGLAAVPTGTRLLGLVTAAWALVLWRRVARPGTDGRRGAVAALLLLVALWAAVDPGWLLGPVLGLAAAGGAVADADGATARRLLRTAAGTLLAGAAVAAVRLAASGDTSATLRTWAEAVWSGPVPGDVGPRPVTDPLVLVVVLPLLLVVGSWLRGVRRPAWTDVVLAGLALLLALGPAGTAPAAGPVAALVVAAALGGGAALGGPATPTTPTSRRRDAVVVAVALLLAAGPAWITSASAAAQDPVVGLRPALQALPPGTPVLADPRLGPRVRAGGSADVVPVPSGPLLAALRAEPGWRELVQDSGARAALLTDEAPLLAALQERLGWRVTARSGAAVLVRAPG